MRRKVDKDLWGKHAIVAGIAFILAAICLAFLYSANSKIDQIENEAIAEFNCDAVDFGYNEDEQISAPLGYYVAIKNYSNNGELTKSYKYHENAKSWYEQHNAASIKRGLSMAGLGMSTLVFFIFACFVVDGIAYTHKLKKL